MSPQRPSPGPRYTEKRSQPAPSPLRVWAMACRCPNSSSRPARLTIHVPPDPHPQTQAGPEPPQEPSSLCSSYGGGGGEGITVTHTCAHAHTHTRHSRRGEPACGQETPHPLAPALLTGGLKVLTCSASPTARGGHVWHLQKSGNRGAEVRERGAEVPEQGCLWNLETSCSPGATACLSRFLPAFYKDTLAAATLPLRQKSQEITETLPLT